MDRFLGTAISGRGQITKVDEQLKRTEQLRRVKTTLIAFVTVSLGAYHDTLTHEVVQLDYHNTSISTYNFELLVFYFNTEILQITEYGTARTQNLALVPECYGLSAGSGGAQSEH